jgi:hypothetical protein
MDRRYPAGAGDLAKHLDQRTRGDEGRLTNRTTSYGSGSSDHQALIVG